MKEMNDRAVSPVVGVMLMLIVTVIIAALISGFSGKLIENTGKAPELTMDVHIRNNGYWTGSEFSARVTGVDKAIPTSDLKIVTTWTHEDYKDGKISGGATILPNVPNVHLVWSPMNGKNYMDEYYWVAPYGYGIGVGDEEGETGTGSGQGRGQALHFGNYSLAVGTVMWAEPFGADTRPTAGGYTGISQTKVGYGINFSRWEYTYDNATGITGGAKASHGDGVELVFNPPDDNKNGLNGRVFDFENYKSSPSYDSMTAVLGVGWENLRAGDIVTVSVVHIPTSKTIWERGVVVEG